jgi:hypothetical protein
VEADVLALVVVDVDCDLFDEMERLAVFGLIAFEIGPNDVFHFFGGQALLELAAMVGVDLIAGFVGLVGRSTNFDGNAVDRVIVGAPNGADDYCERLFLGMLSNEEGVPRTERWQEKQRDDDRIERQVAG